MTMNRTNWPQLVTENGPSLVKYGYKSFICRLLCFS